MDEFINDLSDKVSKCTDPVFEINTVFEHKIFDGVLKLQLEGNYDAELKLLLSLLSKNDLTFIQKLMINQNISTCYRCLNDFNSALPYAKQFVKKRVELQNLAGKSIKKCFRVDKYHPI